jgi:hypothetical protein
VGILNEALQRYAEMWNTHDAAMFLPLLSEDVRMSSQNVLSDLVGVSEVSRYLNAKVEVLSNEPAHRVFAELGVLEAWGKSECVILSQGDTEERQAVVYLTIADNLVSNIDICIIPSPALAVGSGIFPGL